MEMRSGEPLRTQKQEQKYNFAANCEAVPFEPNSNGSAACNPNCLAGVKVTG
jgi:hypothetical protein